MSEILFAYKKVDPTTWAYLSSLLMLGLFFKFNRFWSVRNADLLLLILLAPGLLLVHQHPSDHRDTAQLTTAEPGKPDPTNAFGTDPTESTELAELEAPIETVARDDARLLRAASPDTGPDTSDSNAQDPNTSAPKTDEPDSRDVLLETETTDTQDGASETKESLDNEPDIAAAPDIASGAVTFVPPAEADDVAVTSMSYRERVRWLGYALLMGVGVLLLMRLLIDPTMVRRPLLEPNLTTGGLTFIGCSLFMFLMANVISSNTKESSPTDKPADTDTSSNIAADEAGSAVASASKSASGSTRDQQDQPSEGLEREESGDGSEEPAPPDEDSFKRHGPGYELLMAMPQIVTMPLEGHRGAQSAPLATTTKVMAIFSHLLIVLGMVAIGYRHFGNIRAGIGGATLYLMLPYTAIMTGSVAHAAPAALLTWAVVFYRRPLTAGICIGLAGGMIYYPLFLLPLWISFYWQRGMGRFISGLVCALGVMVIGLAAAHFAGIELLSISPSATFMEKLFKMFGIWKPRMSGLDGLWVDNGPCDPIYRTPVILSFVALSATFAIWPAQKNLGTLLSCTAGIMVAAQCWHGSGGGVFMGVVSASHGDDLSPTEPRGSRRIVGPCRRLVPAPRASQHGLDRSVQRT